MEIERNTLKKIMKHLSVCESHLNVNLRDYIIENMEKAKGEYEDWKKYGMLDEWNKRQNYFEGLLELINKERKIYGELCKDVEKQGLLVEDWIFMEV